MAKRTIRAGIVTYRAAGGREGVFGFLGDEVDVHEDDLERFDRLNPPAPEEAADVDPDGDAFPEGDPSEEWAGKQLDAYATAKSIDLGSAKTKAEKVAVIVAASAPAE